MRAMVPIMYSKSIKQGGTDAPYLWNFVLRRLLVPLAISWQQRGYGITRDNGEVITHLVWADNLFVVSKTVDEAREMVQEVVQGLEEKAKLFIKRSEAYMVANKRGSRGTQGDEKVRQCARLFRIDAVDLLQGRRVRGETQPLG